MTFIKVAFLVQSLLLWIDGLYFDVICNIAVDTSSAINVIGCMIYYNLSWVLNFNVTFDALCILNFNALCI